MEKDDELKGDGNSYDFGARMLDPRVGRWFARDPLSQKYPYDSPYMFSGNSPISIMDPDGERKRKITREIVMDKDGKTIQSVSTHDRIISYELKTITRITDYSSLSGDAIITYDYYDTVDIEIIVKSAEGKIIVSGISKDNLDGVRFKGELLAPKSYLESKDEISVKGFGGFIFSDGGDGSSNREYLRKGDNNAKWLDGKGLGNVLLTLLAKDLKRPGKVTHTTKGDTYTPDQKIKDFIDSVSNSASAGYEALKSKEEKEKIDRNEKLPDSIKVCKFCLKNKQIVDQEHYPNHTYNEGTTTIKNPEKK